MNDQHPKELIEWLESEYEGYTVMFGVPVYKSAKSAMIASAIGFKDNRACILTDPVSIYLFGELANIKLNNKYVIPS